MDKENFNALMKKLDSIDSKMQKQIDIMNAWFKDDQRQHDERLDRLDGNKILT